jgi:hypothetical protein
MECCTAPTTSGAAVRRLSWRFPVSVSPDRPDSPADQVAGKPAPEMNRADTIFSIALLVISGLELTFHSAIPRWVSLGGMPVVLVAIVVYALLRWRRRR